MKLEKENRASSIGNDEEYDVLAMVYVRPINRLPDPSAGKFIAAIDMRHNRSAEKGDWLRQMKDHFFGCLSRVRAYPPEEFKAGVVISDRVGFEVPVDHLEFLFGLEKADAVMARALRSALIGGLMGTVGPIDVEQGVRMLASFLHAHPSFTDAVKKGAWLPPFAENTGYLPVEVREGEEEREGLH